MAPKMITHPMMTTGNTKMSAMTPKITNVHQNSLEKQPTASSPSAEWGGREGPGGM